MRSLFMRGFLPLSLTVSVTTFWFALTYGSNLELAVVLPAVAVMLVGVVAERRWPYRADWSRSRGDLATDLVSAGVLFAALDPLLKWLGPLLATAASASDGTAKVLALFPTSWPFALQVLLATLIAEFGSYWSHRLHHERPSLWWLHALHHGSERLYTLNNFRIHPLNYALNYLMGIMPLLLLGTPETVVLGYLAVTLPVLMVQHANLPLQTGWLNYVFSTSEIHRWHHSSRAGEGDSNFGRSLVIWDQVFGTYRNIPANNHPRKIGLYAGSKYPSRASFVEQVWSMFLPGCCRNAA